MSQQMHHDGGDEDMQMPLGVSGDAAPAEEYSESKVRVNNSTIALFGAFAVALAVLYLLGLQNKPRAASAEETARQNDVSRKIDEMLGSKSDQQKYGTFLDSTTRLLAKLKDYFDASNSGVDITSNPFEHDVKPIQIVENNALTPPVIPTDNVQAALLLKVAAEYNSLKLDLVMLGATPAALINKRMVTVGTKFTYLTVTDIQEGVVMLSFQDKVFRLESNAPQMNKTPH